MSQQALAGVALVTGGAGGIGAATCAALAEAGATVVVIDRSGDRAEAVAASLRSPAEAFVLDVTDAAACEDLVADLYARHGRIDYLAHVAGLAGVADATGDSHPRSLLTVDKAEWDQVVEVNLTGVFNVVRPVARRMVDAGSGAIVVVTAAGAVRVVPGRGAYCAAKAGAAMLVKALGTEIAATGVRVNAVAPGVIETPMTRAGLREGAFSSPPIGRVGRPDEIADAIVYLLGPRSSYVTAKTVHVDGGLLTG